MTEQPPVTPEEPVDNGEDVTPPTQTEKDAEKTAQQTEIASTEYSAADHHTYSMMMYQQPAWVVDAVFASGQLDPNQKHTPGQVQAAIDSMMAASDKQFEEVQ